VEISRIAAWNLLHPEVLQKQYKNYLSDFPTWDQKDHCLTYLLFPENLGARLSIDETALSNGELYTIITNKDARGRKGALVAMIKGTKASVVSEVLMKLPVSERMKVLEVTLDMANTMDWIVRESFPNAQKVTDRFHVQKLVSEALQEIRIKERWKAMEEESEAVEACKKKGISYKPPLYSNGDSKKQLLARSRYLLFKPRSKWKESQKQRAGVLFTAYPELEEGYRLSMMFRSFYEHSRTREEGKKQLEQWYEKVEEKRKKNDAFKPFQTAASSVKAHEGTILNYFHERATNASAESFNAKLKGFRALVRGVSDMKFFLFRVTTFFA